MDDLRSHMEKCDVVREQLDEWYNGRIRVEAELSKLAWHFEKWGQESESRTAAGSTVGKSKKSGAKEGNITKWMDFVVELLESDRILSDKLFNSIAELQTNEAVLSFKIQCGIFEGDGRDSPTGSRPRNNVRERSYSRENVEFLLRQKVKTPLLLNAIGTLAISVPWHLAEVVRRIKDLAGADRRSRCETAKVLHVFAASAKIQREEYYKALLCLRHSINLEPKSLIPRILALRWSAFLGEWEMAEMALAFEKAKHPMKNGVNDHLVDQLIFTTKITKAYVDFNCDQRSRPPSSTTILSMTEKANSDERPTFPVFGTQAFAN